VSLRVVIAGGGTAGHVYPGIALAHALVAERGDAEVSFVGTKRGIETTAVPAAGFRLHLVEVVPWARTLGAKRFVAPASLVPAVARARTLLTRERAQVVVGMGGYASMPVVLAARTKGIPVVLHEQNAVPGMANLAGARVTRNIALVFEEARSAFPRSARVRVVGNPIRESIARLDREASRSASRAALELKPDRATVVLFGGSLGAARLNAAAVGIAERWRDATDRQMLVIAGPKHAEEVKASMTSGAPCHVLSYLDRMEHAYAAADVVVSRSGATTVAEIAAAGVPSILVPYPYARRDHQTANARSLARTGAALVVPDAEATADRLGRMVDGLLGDPARMRTMAEAAKGFGKPDAARQLARWVIELAERR
jgi:UDP-N-acetylglucosamine--N-acetylmuramyl-(pentapeptide) pyrophosphoryl-undecaprenol N-acetylglucosamine transferase